MLFHLFRYILLGPILGAWIGLTQTAVAASVWATHGQPDFYFRTWTSVWIISAILSVGGFIMGVPFGAAVAAAEHLLRRQVWVAPALACAVVTTGATTWVTVEIEFYRREMLPVFTQQGVALSITGGLLLAWSRPRGPNDARLSVPHQSHLQ